MTSQLPPAAQLSPRAGTGQSPTCHQHADTGTLSSRSRAAPSPPLASKCVHCVSDLQASCSGSVTSHQALLCPPVPLALLPAHIPRQHDTGQLMKITELVCSPLCQQISLPTSG
ncbi:PDZ domain containing 11 [Columba livia]|uniref:PDZ domain containing 11 n=1 Tax=Columba livia TaxID=8932 RepID=A0A2I0LS60_COLLI|nr:PDZ domain containing 11 [Columba livia]